MDKKIFVVCPAYYKTSGTELLHQLVLTLNSKGIDLEIAYLNSTKEKNINPAFLQYTKVYCNLNEATPTKNTLFVIPETCTWLLKTLPPEQCIIWWESVDNYKVSFKNDFHYNGILKSVWHLLKKHL